MLNKTFRLFISSTFSDFLVERNIINNEIFPHIDDYCQKQGYNFQIIDLRWGINNESALNQNTIAICLDEVERCRTLSPKPNFLIMAGERYGWIPLPSHILASDYSDMISAASDEQKQLIEKWYVYDENEIVNRYYLKTRENEYTDETNWSVEEQALQNALIDCVRKKWGDNQNMLKKITASATEHEIMEGLLENDDICNNTIAVFRTNYLYKDENQNKIISLKNRISQKMYADGCEENLINIECGEHYCNHFKDKVIALLIKNISAEIERLNTIEDNSEIEKLSEMVLGSADVLFERTKETNTLAEYINGDAQVPLFITGDSGSGKTTLLAQYVKNAQTRVVYSFYGIDEASYTLYDALSSISTKIKTEFNTLKQSYNNENNLTEMLYEAIYSVPENEKLVIIIDGLDMFHDINDINEKIFPSKLPNNVKLIVSSADTLITARFMENSFYRLCIERFNFDESRKHFDSLMAYKNRRIAVLNQNKLVNKTLIEGATPLQLKIMSDICSNWHSNDIISELPDSQDGIALKYLSDMYLKFGHNRYLVLNALALIAASPYGITEDELQVLLFRYPKVKEYFISEDRYNHQFCKLPFVIWSRLFYDLKGCLTLIKSKGNIVVKFVHQIFYRVISDTFPDYYNDAVDMLIEYYYQQDNYTVNELKLPNVRKAYALPILLIRKNRTEELENLLIDLTFIDSTVKTGNVNEIISNIQFLLKKITSSEKLQVLMKIYNCLQKNRDMLNCYYSEFFTCAYHHKLIDTKPLLVCETPLVKNETFYFPYSNNARIVWNKNGSKYAVFQKNYVYICTNDTHTQLCRIYLEPDSEKNKTAREIMWLSEHEITIVTHNGEILNYDFADGIPNLISSLNLETDKIYVKCSQKHRLILFQKEKNIYAYNPGSSEYAYKIELNNKEKIDFEPDDERNQLAIMDNSGKVIIFDLSDGSLKEEFRLNSKRSFLDSGNNPGLYQINDKLWLEFKQNSLFGFMGWNSVFAIHDTENCSKVFLHPPWVEKVVNALLGRKILLIVYPNIIVSINLAEKFEMSYYPILNICNAAWKIKDEEISVVTDAGLIILKLSEFSQFSGNLKYCITFSKNILGKFRLNKNKIKHYFNKSIVFYLNMQINMHNWTDYDLFFPVQQALSFDAIDVLTNMDYINASLIAFASDNKTAAAYEKSNTIIIFDPLNNPLCQIDKLKLSLFDNLLKMFFSPDSKKLLIWRNFSLSVIHSETGRKLLYIDLTFRPALDVKFSEDSEKLNLTLCDGKTYSCSLNNRYKKQTKEMPRKLLEKNLLLEMTDYTGPYNCYLDEDGSLNGYPMIVDINCVADILPPKQWLRNERVYHSEKIWVFFKNGEFYLEARKQKIFQHSFFDFNKSLKIEMLRDSSTINEYLREKNDISSDFINLDDVNVLLISKRLNSVILFDIDKMKVLTAYKINGNIVGCRTLSQKCFEIIYDKSPYKLIIEINLPHYN